MNSTIGKIGKIATLIHRSLEEESCLSMQDPTWWLVPEVSAPHFVQKLHHRQWELVAFHIFGLGPLEVNPNQTTPPLPHSIACSHKLDLRKCLPKQLLSPVPREVSKPTSELSIPALLTNIYCRYRSRNRKVPPHLPSIAQRRRDSSQC